MQPKHTAAVTRFVDFIQPEETSESIIRDNDMTSLYVVFGIQTTKNSRKISKVQLFFAYVTQMSYNGNIILFYIRNYVIAVAVNVIIYSQYIIFYNLNTIVFDHNNILTFIRYIKSVLRGLDTVIFCFCLTYT